MRGLRWAVAAGAVLALVGAACGTTSSGGSSASGGPSTIKPSKVYSSIGKTEGELNLIAWNGYVEDGSNDPNYDWVTPFEKETGCKVNVKYADTSDEMVTLMRQGGGSRLRRRLGLGRRDEPAHRRRRRRGGGRLTASRHEGRHLAARARWHEDRPLHRRRLPVRRAVDVRAELPHVQHRRREAGADELGHHVRAGLAVRGQGHGLRLPDLHRRRGDVPEDAQPGPRHHRPVRAHAGATRRGDGPVEDPIRDSSASTGRCTRTRSTGSWTAAWSSGPRGRSTSRTRRPTRRWTRSSRPRA